MISWKYKINLRSWKNEKIRLKLQKKKMNWEITKITRGVGAAERAEAEAMANTRRGCTVLGSAFNGTEFQNLILFDCSKPTFDFITWHTSFFFGSFFHFQQSPFNTVLSHLPKSSKPSLLCLVGSTSLIYTLSLHFFYLP